MYIMTLDFFELLFNLLLNLLLGTINAVVTNPIASRKELH